jgi:hypothetical protein
MKKVLALAMIPLLSFFIAVHLRADDRVIEKSGIHYPDGYDVNTVGVVQGKARNLYKPERGPLRFSLVSKTGAYTVLLSPPWYWNQQKASIQDGDDVRITGSKSLGKDGNLYIIAQEVRLPGAEKTLLLRDKNGFPLWKLPGTAGGQGGSRPQGTDRGPSGKGNTIRQGP